MQIDPSKVQWDPTPGPAQPAGPPSAVVAAPPVAPSAAAPRPPAIDPAAVKWDAEPASAPAAPPKRTAGEDLGRQMGLTVRHAVNGVAALPAMAADAVTGVANTVMDKAMGEGKGFRFQKQAPLLDKTLTQLGLPEPETAQERVVGDATSALAGTGALVKAGQALAQRGGTAITQGVGDALAAGPKMQALSSVTSAGAAGATREAGGNEWAQLAAGLAGGVAPSVLNPRRVLAEGGRQAQAAAAQANKNGFVVPPVDLSPGAGIQALSGFSGKVKTAQVASARNQTVSNSLARKALGLGDDVDLNVGTLEGIRRTAAQAYAPVAGSGIVTPGASFSQALDDAVKPFMSQSKSFPGMKVPEVVNDIAALRSPQFDAGDALNAIRTMREGADKAYRAGEAQSGKAYRQAAAALEDALESHLQGLGQPGADILRGFRDARQQIAKSWTVQNALNPATGNVNAIKLAADLAKNKPLSGELRTVAEFGQAFPKAAQSLKEAPGATSPLDWIPATLTAISTGNPLPMAAVGARPAARNLLLSQWQQQRALQTAGTKSVLPEGAGAATLGAAARSGEVQQEPDQVYKNRLQAGYAARMGGGEVVPVPGGFVVRKR